MWDPYNAALIDLPPRLSVERILGELMPSDLIASFRGAADESGRFEWVDVARCPLAAIDPNCPAPQRLPWFDDLAGYARELAAKLPTHWLPPNPTNVLRSGLVILKAESESAVSWRATKKERW